MFCGDYNPNITSYNLCPADVPPAFTDGINHGSFVGQPSDHDVITFIKKHISDHELAQPPMLVLTHLRASRMNLTPTTKTLGFLFDYAFLLVPSRLDKTNPPQSVSCGHPGLLAIPGKRTTIPQLTRRSGGRLRKLCCSPMATSTKGQLHTWRIWLQIHIGKTQI